MEITNLFKVNNAGKLKATFTVEFSNLSIRDFKLVEGEGGELWPAAPSRQYKAKTGEMKWMNVVQINDPALLESIGLKARELYQASK